MSASKEKKKRLETKGEGIDKRAAQALEEAEKKKKFRIKAIIAAVVVVIVLAFAVVLNTDFIYTKMTALTVGSKNYTVADFNYWYGSAYLDFYDSNYDAIDSGYYFNTAKSLRSQYVDEEKTQTWADYFKASALSTMKSVTALNKAADEAGFELTEEDEASLRSAIDRTDYASMGYSSLKNYLKALYGRGVSKKVYTDNYRLMYRAALYSAEVLAGYDFSEDELTAFYAENKDKYDRYIYNMYYIPAEKSETEEKASDEAKAAAKAIADDVAGAKTIEDFSARILKHCEEKDVEKYSDPAKFRYSYTLSGLSNTFKDFLTAEDTEPNDTTIIEMTNGYYVLFFIEQGGNNYNVVNYRQIKFNVATDPETGLITEEAYNNASIAAQGVANMAQRTPTEENFIELIGGYSADQTDIYENVAKDETEDGVEAWLFDEARQPGDISGAIEGTNCFYVLYYQGTGEVYWKYIAEKGLSNKTYSDWINSMVEEMGSKDGWLLRFADYQART